MPDQALIDELKQKMSLLGIEKPDDSSPDGIGFTEVTKVAKDASAVLEKAQSLADQVNKAIEKYTEATSNCNLAKEHNKQANDQTGNATVIINSTVKKIETLSQALTNLTDFVNGEGEIGKRMIDLNRKITEANSNVETALNERDSAEEIYTATKAKLDQEKAENDLENKVDTFTDSINKMRQTEADAKNLENNVKNLIDEVETYKQNLQKLKSDYDKVKDEVNKEKVKELFCF